MRSDSKPAFAPQVPRNAAAAQNTRHLAPELTVNDRTPGHEQKLMAVFNQREATRRQIDPAAINTRYVVALLDWPICQPGLTRDLRCCTCQLAPGQRVEKVSSEDRLSLSLARQPAIHQSLGPLRQRSPNLGSESCLGKLRLLAPHELSIEPGGTRGNDLAFQWQSGKRP